MPIQKLNSFAKFAWFAVVYNLLVVLWGVFLRASHSGDGCGQHWLTCGGEAIPTAPQLKTVIEFSHRITTAAAGLVVLILVCWAFAQHDKFKYVRLFAGLSFLFILIEGAIGGGLVLTGNTAANWTPTRPYWTAGHLINTFVLIAFLTLTAWSASERREFKRRDSRSILLLFAGAGIIVFVGISGSMAALSTMLFPAESLREGLAMDFDPLSHPLLRLRIIHPISAIIGAVFLIFISSRIRAMSASSEPVRNWSSKLSALVIAQIVFGAATLLMLGPIVMQLGHLLLADLVWIAFVLLFANHFNAAGENSSEAFTP